MPTNHSVAARVFAFVSFACSIAACSSSVSGDGADGAGGLSSPSCAPGEFVVEGTQDFASVSVREPGRGLAFINKLGVSPGKLTVSSARVSAEFSFDVLLASGATAPSRGTVRVRAAADEPEVNVGNCPTGPLVSEIRYASGAALGDPSTYYFTLKQATPSASCTEVAAAGVLRGCYADAPR